MRSQQQQQQRRRLSYAGPGEAGLRGSVGSAGAGRNRGARASTRRQLAAVDKPSAAEPARGRPGTVRGGSSGSGGAINANRRRWTTDNARELLPPQ